VTTVAVTGAAGFLGRHLCARLADGGVAVRALVRRPDGDPIPGARSVARLDLPDAIDEGALRDVDVLLHAAWTSREPDARVAERVNVEGTRRLLAAARRAGIGRVVFVSSVAAAADAPNVYGRTKAAAEALLDPVRDVVVRPGTILSCDRGGIFGLMTGLMRRVHVVPLFGGGRQPLQTVHVDDATEALARVIEHGLTGALNVAEPAPRSFRDVLRIAADCMRVRCVFVPLPFAPVLAAVRLAERAGLPTPLKSESLLGLQGLRVVAVERDLAMLDLRVRPVTESLRDIFVQR